MDFNHYDSDEEMSSPSQSTSATLAASVPVAVSTTLAPSATAAASATLAASVPASVSAPVIAAAVPGLPYYDPARDPRPEFLYEMPFRNGKTKPELWQFIRLVSGTPNPPPGTSSNAAVKIWCLKCHGELTFKNKDTRCVVKHMARVHQDEIDMYLAVHDEDAVAVAAVALQAPAPAVQAPRAAAATRVRPAQEQLAPPTAAKRSRGPQQSWEGDALAEIAPMDGSALATLGTWRKPFLNNPFWTDLHGGTKPVHFNLHEAMLTEMVWALPPCDGRRVVDLGAGTGRAAAAVLAAYNTAELELVDSSPYHLEVASRRIELQTPGARAKTTALEIRANDDEPLIPGRPADVIIGCLAFSALANQAFVQRAAATLFDAYEMVLRLAMRSLSPGGYLIIGDEESSRLPLHVVLRAVEAAGYAELKIVWCRDGFFVVGGRKPIQFAATV